MHWYVLKYRKTSSTIKTVPCVVLHCFIHIAMSFWDLTTDFDYSSCIVLFYCTAPRKAGIVRLQAHSRCLFVKSHGPAFQWLLPYLSFICLIVLSLKQTISFLFDFFTFFVLNYIYRTFFFLCIPVLYVTATNIQHFKMCAI